jgi:CubicO group peptidase (beta-lactamase class C family)
VLATFCPFGFALASTCSFDAATSRFDDLVTSQSLPGGALLVGDRNGILLERYVGDYGPQTRVALASATKLLSAVRIVQLAEQGEIDLEAPVSNVLPQFQGTKGTMTVAQMFSHTSGYGDDAAAWITLTPSLNLAEAVDTIACCFPLPNGWTPGGQFAYGGISMHIAGRVAEVVGGGDWQAQWQQHIGAALQIASIDYQAFGPTTNYSIGGGAQSTLRDYGRVLHMLLNHGRNRGARVLHPGSVRALFRDRIGARPVTYAPPAANPPLQYGLGNWLDPSRANPDQALGHSLGAFGFFPFVDFRDGIFGAFMIRAPSGINETALPVYEAMLLDIRNERGSNDCEPVEWFPDIAGDGFESPRVELDPH